MIDFITSTMKNDFLRKQITHTHTQRYEPYLNPQPEGLQCSVLLLTTAPSECPIIMHGDY